MSPIKVHILFLALVAALYSPTPAYAGFEVGNGGDIIQCPEISPWHTNLLDYYEAQNYLGFHIDLDINEVRYEPLVRRVFDRLKIFDPDRGAKYLEWFQGFENDEAAHLSGVRFVDIPDSLEKDLPKGCVLRQIAIQKPPTFKGEKRYSIDEDLFSLLSGRNKAGLIIHELILREALEVEHNNSIPTRYLNGLISSSRFLASHQHYLDTIKKMKFAYTIQGVPLNYEGMRFGAKGRLSEAQLLDSPNEKKCRTLKSGTNSFCVFGTVTFDIGMQRQFTGIRADGRKQKLTFDKEGNLVSIQESP